jgi:hypothetical protein
VDAPALAPIPLDGVPDLNNEHVVAPDGERIYLSVSDVTTYAPDGVAAGGSGDGADHGIDRGVDDLATSGGHAGAGCSLIRRTTSGMTSSAMYWIRSDPESMDSPGS